MNPTPIARFLLTGFCLFAAGRLAQGGDSLDQLLPVRGLCIGAPNPSGVDTFVKFISEELAPRSVNTLILRVDYNYQYTSRPELANPSGLSREDVKKLVVVCRTNHIRLIPQINLLGHQSWQRSNGKLLQVYPEFDETPWVKVPEKYSWPNPDGLYCRSYCPLNPKVHDVVFPLVDEICEAFETDAFHAGMDEVFYIGEAKCPRCGGKDKSELFANEVNLIRNHLKQSNRQLWIWGDRLLDGKTTGMGEWEASLNDTHRAIDLVAKDVFICDWHYERADLSAVYFAMKGFSVVTCPWQNPRTAVQQLQDVRRFREQAPGAMKPRFQGVVQTVWSGVEPFLRDFEGHRKSEDYKKGEKSAARCFFRLFDEIQTLERAPSQAAVVQPSQASRDYKFDRTIPRLVLENYLSRSITMEGLLNGRGDLDDNIRMLKTTGAKFIGRSLCLWGGEANLLRNLERAKEQAPKIHAADPEMILQSCIFEIVTTDVEQVPVPEWAFEALGQPVEKRNFRYAGMLYPDGRFKNHWRPGQSVPDVSQPETMLWFYFLGRSFIDVGCEAIHLGQTELMNHNDRDLAHYAQVLTLLRSYAAKHARRHMVLFDSHVPSGGLVRDGALLMDFHSFPLRIMEVPEKPQEAILKLGFSDGLYGRSKGGKTFSGWICEHLPYLVEIDNWGVSADPGQPKAGSIWIWGYDEITWFAHQPKEYRANWLRYARDWVQKTDPNGFLEMPGSRTLSSPRDKMRWYYANNPGPSVPGGFGDEETIRALWSSDPK